MSEDNYNKLLCKYNTLLEAHKKLSAEYNEIVTNYSNLAQRHAAFFNKKHWILQPVQKPYLHGDDE